MAKKKADSQIVKLVDKEPDENGQKVTPSVYYTRKNRKNTPGKLVLKKYNKYKRCHTEHTEVKS